MNRKAIIRALRAALRKPLEARADHLERTYLRRSEKLGRLSDIEEGLSNTLSTPLGEGDWRSRAAAGYLYGTASKRADAAYRGASDAKKHLRRTDRRLRMLED